MAVQRVTRQSWEPAHDKFFAAGKAAAWNPFTMSKIVHAIIATNNGASATTMTITDGSTEIGTLAVPANSTEHFPIPSCGLHIDGGLTVTPAAALDVTILTA